MTNDKEPAMRKALVILGALFFTSSAHAVRIADITRISGQRSNVLTGIGLVTGLKGTGDGGDFQPAIRQLAQLLGAFDDPTTARDLADVQNVALVGLVATVPKDGVRNGDKLDVYVTCWGKATSLKGGRLFPSLMQGAQPEHDADAFAVSPGQSVPEE